MSIRGFHVYLYPTPAQNYIMLEIRTMALKGVSMKYMMRTVNWYSKKTLNCFRWNSEQLDIRIREGVIYGARLCRR